MKGKTAYMSPEQAMGDPLDRRSDLFGVGAVLFELRRAAVACGAAGRTWTYIRQLALAEPPKLSEAAPDAPRALHELHARLVSKKPADRPATAGEVATVLRTLHSRDEARHGLERLLREHYEPAAKEKRHKLEAAMSSRSPDSGLAVSGSAPARASSRAAPWLIAIASAAIASAAVFAMSRNRTPSTPAAAPTIIVTVSASAPAQSSIAVQPVSTTTAAPIRTARPRVGAPRWTASAPASAAPARAAD